MKLSKKDLKKRERGDLDVIFETIRKKQAEKERMKPNNTQEEDKVEAKVKSEDDIEKECQAESFNRQKESSRCIKQKSKDKNDSEEDDTKESRLKKKPVRQKDL